MSDDITWIKTHCARMDHGGCGIIAGVRNGRIIKVKGDPEGYLNRGYICSKGRLSPEKLSHSSRLKTPLKRVGARGEGKWKPISWSLAIDEIAGHFKRIKKETGPEAVAFCQGMPKGLEHFVLIRLANVFGSPNVVAVQDVCHAPREVGGIHTCGFYPVADLHNPSQTVVLWGSNLTHTNEEGQICKLLADQRKAGARLVVIDPKKTALAEQADIWLQVAPGADNALALAFLNVVIEGGLYDRAFVEDWVHGFEELSAHVRECTPEKMVSVTGVAPELVRHAAGLYAGSRPSAIQWGNPIEQHSDCFDTVRSIISLMAVCGNIDIPGGNICANEPDILPLGKFVRAKEIPEKPKTMIHASHQTIPKLMTVPATYFKQAALESYPYPVKAAYVQCANPLMSYAESQKTYEALMALECLVVSDIFMTPTAALADIVLPAATHFEFNDIGHYGLGHGCILARPKIVEPAGECRPDMDILNALGKAISPEHFWHENYQGFLEELLAPAGLSYSQFVGKGYLAGPERFQKHMEKGFKTPSGKVEVLLSRAEKLGVSPLPEIPSLLEKDSDYPLVLTSAKSPNYLHSSYRWVKGLRDREPEPVAEIHPDTAEQSGVTDGEEVVIATPSGKIVQRVRVTRKILPGVVSAAYGWWFPESGPEAMYEWKRSNYNMLTSTIQVGKEFGTPDLKGINCRIEPNR